MIYLEMSGRMGNQMFRYAFARWLMLQGNEPEEELVIDFSHIFEEQAKNEMPGWEDSLQELNTIPYRYYEGSGRMLMEKTSFAEKTVLMIMKAGDVAAEKMGPRVRLKWRKLFMRWQNRHGLYLMFTGYDAPYYWVKGRKIAAAPFECARYCEEIREVLLREFTPKKESPKDNRELMNRITGSESVCVTIRRGNFLKYKALDVCGKEYFERAAGKISQLIEHPVFFVFSDDIEWARKTLVFPGPVYYESGQDPTWEKLRLMYSCKHFIISNSTFSWWAQFLGRADDKIVIAPDHWYNVNYEPPLYESGWIRVEA